MNRFIVGFGSDTNEYMVNGVRYIVGSCYTPVNFRHMDKNTRIDHRLENYIAGDFAELMLPQSTDTMKVESVCSAAGEEDNNAAEPVQMVQDHGTEDSVPAGILQRHYQFQDLFQVHQEQDKA